MVDQILSVSGLTVAYGGIHAVREVDLEVPANTTVALIGANGAGKTSTIRGIGGQVRSKGDVTFCGQSISGKSAHSIARMGLAQVPQGRRVFPAMTVTENLELVVRNQSARGRQQRIKEAFDIFPRLGERADQQAGTLSGGEQQMLAIGRALVTQPKLIAMDEPSLGLAPIIVNEVFEVIQQIKQAGTSILLVEQNALKALEVSDYAYIVKAGSVVTSMSSGDALQKMEDLHNYLI